MDKKKLDTNTEKLKSEEEKANAKLRMEKLKFRKIEINLMILKNLTGMFLEDLQM